MDFATLLEAIFEIIKKIVLKVFKMETGWEPEEEEAE